MTETKSGKNTQKKASGPRGPYTPEATQSRIIAKKITGKTNSAIAREEGVARSTVREILGHRQYQEIVRAHRQEVLDLIPGSIGVFRKAIEGVEAGDMQASGTKPIEVLDGDDLKRRLDQAFKRGLSAGLDALKAATDVLKGSQVFVTREEKDVTVADETRAMSPEEREARIAELWAKRTANAQ